MSNQEQSGKMWSGRFREPLDAVFEQWQRSFPFDVRLLPQEVAASKAHARMIAAAGILTDAELERMIEGLDQVGDITPEFAPLEPGMVNPRLLGAELGTTPRSIRRWLNRQPEFNESHVKHTRIVLAKDDPLLLRMKSHFAIQANLNLDGDGACEEFPATTEADVAASMANAEDIHHFVELQLAKVIGPLALKLHTGRSRNEQIATDMRLFVREAIDATVKGLRKWGIALIELAEQAGDAVMPSYTHMQRAEPVLVAHWLLAYGSMIERNISRLMDARKRMNYCPLGSGAVAGATLALDRRIAARELGFDAPTANSLDATSDRDFLLEFTQTLAALGVHISRFAEELTLYATAEFGFLDLPEAYSTGSSAMPQKKNPDFTELLRGKSARLAGAATTLTVLMKGLPLAYNKDLQEGQETVFDAADTARGILGILPAFTRSLKFNFERMKTAATTGYLNAMAAATYLSNKGVAFRKAHEIVGNAVRLGLESGRELDAIPLAELQGLSEAFGEDFHAAIALEATLDCHDVVGGTARARVHAALAEARERLSSVAAAQV
ncbi:MAG: argininosuccinate lyase [Acidobacteriaceae bacterium]